VNGVIVDVLSTKKNRPIDIQIFDYKQCFDSLWLQECLNDMYENGVKDDKLALLYNINTHVKITVKTPVGKTRRGSIPKAMYLVLFCVRTKWIQLEKNVYRKGSTLTHTRGRWRFHL
jgi:hypothetical protein